MWQPAYHGHCTNRHKCEGTIMTTELWRATETVYSIIIQCYFKNSNESDTVTKKSANCASSQQSRRICKMFFQNLIFNRKKVFKLYAWPTPQTANILVWQIFSGKMLQKTGSDVWLRQRRYRMCQKIISTVEILTTNDRAVWQLHLKSHRTCLLWSYLDM